MKINGYEITKGINKMNAYKVEAINLNMGQGEMKVTKIIKAGNIESVLTIYYSTYLTIEIISITKIENEIEYEKNRYGVVATKSDLDQLKQDTKRANKMKKDYFNK